VKTEQSNHYGKSNCGRISKEGYGSEKGCFASGNDSRLKMKVNEKCNIWEDRILIRFVIT
jgi:hypothetical protein